MVQRMAHLFQREPGARGDFGGGNPIPTLTTDPGCRLIMLGDTWGEQAYGTNIGRPSTAMPDTPNPPTDGNLSFLADGLDHLRQLDLEDLKVQGFSGDSAAAK